MFTTNTWVPNVKIDILTLENNNYYMVYLIFERLLF